MGEKGQLEILLRGEKLTLLPQKAIWWVGKKALLIADMHLGKSGHFRSHGIAVPGQVNSNTLYQFEKLLKRWEPEQVVFMGDLFHSTYNKEWEAFVEVLNRYPSRWLLVRGNHDILADEKYSEAGIEVVENIYPMGPFLLSHEPVKKVPEDSYVLAGHVHPGVRLVGLGRQKLSLPCFYFGEQQGIVPAFGHFTGLYIMEADEARAIYAIAEETVMQVHGEVLGS